MTKSLVAHVFVKSGSIYVKLNQNDKWPNSTPIVEYISPVVHFSDIYL